MVEKRELNRGGGLYCSRICMGRHHSHTSAMQYATNHPPNAICAFCQQAFYKQKSHFANSRSGLLFCTRHCKDQAQRLESGIVAIQPSHYDLGQSVYRAAALRNYPNICNSCGYDTIPDILEVHHKDHNHTNNSLENLEILCPRCHAEHHFNTKTGKWRV